MSLAEQFLNTAKELLMATENIKRLDERVDRLADDVAGVNHRLVRVEALIEFSKGTSRRRLPAEKE
jgi:hypothetical protein